MSDELATYVAAQRWFGAHDKVVRATRELERESIGDGVHWVLLEMLLDPGPPGVYQLVLDDSGVRDVADHPAVMAWMFPDLAGRPVRLLAGEQSNTSLVVGDDIIVKLFRRLGAKGEPNPDAETVRGLWEHGFRSVPEPLGEFRRDGWDLAVARRFLAGSSSGWEMALEDPHVLDELRDLGAVTAAMHVALADAFGSGPGAGATWAAAMDLQAERVPLRDELDPRPHYRALAAAEDVGRAIRTHGDYHLGQVLHNRGDWYVLDFEGEPARPVAERVAPSSPLRDVAGMLRSFGYAAAVGGLPAEWEPAARSRFLDGYYGHAPVGALLPSDPEPVLAAFELDKAVYEVGYERASRPDWERIPLAAVQRLVASR
jgi:maltokinase